MSRKHCQRCNYPLSTCVCSAIIPMRVKTRITFMVHPLEQGKAKNTGRLVPLLIPHAEVIVGESARDFDALRHRINGCQKTVVLFPCTNSRNLSDLAIAESVEHLIVIDGTWRKAKKIWLLNPWLQELRVGHLNIDVPSQYRIRKGSFSDGMASIEAVAAGLEITESVDTGPLWSLFEAMQSKWPSS